MNEEGGLWNRALVKRVATDTERGLHASQDPELRVLPGSLGKSQCSGCRGPREGFRALQVLLSPLAGQEAGLVFTGSAVLCWTSPLALAGPHLPLAPHIPEAPLERTPPHPLLLTAQWIPTAAISTRPDSPPSPNVAPF